MFMIDNRPLALDVAFTHAEIQYPANWLRLASPEERAAIGITEVADPVPHDDRFWWSPGVPKDLDQLKVQMVGQVKSIAGSLLAPTDWKITRAAEGVKAVDADTLVARAAIRAASDSNEALVTACTTVDQIAAVQFAWPQEELQSEV
jgi:hypothetical protein